ncbi:hypothetical protein PsorP6_014293 [Peronosclerospora sorghi]|uniref:Uncharacterized protein n=1 Tax=Peronosclerospora sorghi TaxID=230839 RepID=A0ACC0VHQ9_9STRA|nr:hypothetical protein PsorP6_014293 [Peronosclerospora sorghi]
MQSIAPPAEGVYASAEAAEATLHAWTKARGYNVTRDAIRRNAHRVIMERLFRCDRGGNPQNTRKLTPAQRIRAQRASKRIGCPMRIKIRAVDELHPYGPWKVVYTRDGSTMHNHPPSDDPLVHACHRRRARATLHAVPKTVETRSGDRRQGLLVSNASLKAATMAGRKELGRDESVTTSQLHTLVRLLTPESGTESSSDPHRGWVCHPDAAPRNGRRIGPPLLANKDVAWSHRDSSIKAERIPVPKKTQHCLK